MTAASPRKIPSVGSVSADVNPSARCFSNAETSVISESIAFFSGWMRAMACTGPGGGSRWAWLPGGPGGPAGAPSLFFCPMSVQESMNPAVTVLPVASRTKASAGGARSLPTASISPSRSRMVPFSIVLPGWTMTRA